MIKKSKKIRFTVCLLLFTLHSHHGGQASLFALLHAETISTQRLAFVDLDRIYEKFPMKALAEEEIELKKEEFRRKLAETDKKIRELELKQELESREPEIALSTQTEVVSSTQTEVASSTQPVSVAAPPDVSTETVKGFSISEQISALKEERKELSEKAGSVIKGMQSGYSVQIMGKIYDAIKEVADFHGYTVVINKSECLYGIPASDLTDEVLKKL
ncbi:MAG: OmpH family outer membrane protein [bacterium]